MPRIFSIAQSDYRSILRYGLVGMANTAVGYSVILAGLAAGLGDIASNATGYAAGLTLSFVLNRRWTFGERAVSRGAPMRFLLSFAVAYGANLAVVLAGEAAGRTEDPLVHLVAMGAYSVVFYLGMSNFVFTDAPRTGGHPDGWTRRLLSRHWPELALGAAFLAGLVLLWGIPVSLDVVWQMWIAQQLLHSAKLYVDILEVNPPLWFWMALPVQQVANATGIASPHLMAAAVYLYGGLALVLLALLVADWRARERALLMGAAFVAITAVALNSYAQREHIALIAAVPYALLAARRGEATKVNPWLALCVGLLAGLGFGLKHYFVLVPLSLEVWLYLRQRSLRRLVRPETVALAVLAVAYAAAVFHFAPEFFKNIVPLVMLAYDGYKTTLLVQLANPAVAAWVLVLIGLWRARSSATPVTMAFLLAGIAFMASYFIQAKGWSYHALPANGCLFIAAASVVMRMDRAALVRNPYLAAAMLLPLAVAAVRGPYDNELRPYMLDKLASVPRGSVAFMIDVNPSRVWPMVANEGYRWPSRYYSFWMLPTIATYEHDHGRLSPQLQTFADSVRAQLLHDLQCNPPALVIVDDPHTVPALDAAGFDYLAFFRRNAGIADLLAHYSHEKDKGIFDIFRKPAGWRPPRPEGCREISVL